MPSTKPYLWSIPQNSIGIYNTPFAVKICFDDSLRIFDRRTGLWLSYQQWKEVIETNHFTDKERKFLKRFLEKYPSELDVRIYFAENMSKRGSLYYSKWMRDYLKELKEEKLQRLGNIPLCEFKTKSENGKVLIKCVRTNEYIPLEDFREFCRRCQIDQCIRLGIDFSKIQWKRRISRGEEPNVYN